MIFSCENNFLVCGKTDYFTLLSENLFLSELCLQRYGYMQVFFFLFFSF